jgi:hypothetical protein
VTDEEWTRSTSAIIPRGEILRIRREPVLVPLCPPQILIAWVRQWSSAVRLRQGTTQDFTNVNIIYVSMNVKYGLQSDTWYVVYTLISNFLRTIVPKLLQGLPPAVRQRLCFHKMELMHCMGNITHSGWTRQFYYTYEVYGVWSLDTLRHCKYHVSQKAKVSGYMLWNFSDLLCNKESDYRDLVCEFIWKLHAISLGILKALGDREWPAIITTKLCNPQNKLQLSKEVLEISSNFVLSQLLGSLCLVV